MNLIQAIRADYKEFVRITPMDSELRKALGQWAPHQKLIANLARELSKKKNLKREEIKLATYSLSEWFMNGVKLKADERRMSDLQKSIKKAEADKKAKLLKEANDYADTVKIETLDPKKVKAKKV